MGDTYTGLTHYEIAHGKCRCWYLIIICI